LQALNHSSQIHQNQGLRPIFRNDPKVLPLIGGLSQAKQKRLLSYHPEIIVATPGRLKELLDESDVIFIEPIHFFSKARSSGTFQT
jgi:superfamily II DNA/RNA helicase